LGIGSDTTTGGIEAPVTQHAQIPLSQDAALVVALAGTALPFAHSAEDEAERWLRAMRLHGQVGKVLQALGVGEAPLTTESEGPVGDSHDNAPIGPQVLDEVARRAGSVAAERDSETAGTTDLLFAVLDVYDQLFDRALYVRGTSRDELLEHLGDPHPARSGG
jgi:hypothetical protein